MTQLAIGGNRPREGAQQAFNVTTPKRLKVLSGFVVFEITGGGDLRTSFIDTDAVLLPRAQSRRVQP
jgi:hypothetical protein